MPRYEITTLKNMSAYRWVNAYEVLAPDFAVAEAVGNAIVVAEKAMTYTQVAFERMKVALVPDPNRTEFIVNPLGGTGARTEPNDQLLGPQIVLFGKFGADKGLPGKKFYRYVLRENDIQGSGEGWTFASNAVANDYLTLVTNVLTAIQGAGGQLYIGNKGRIATGETGVSIGNLGTRHGWFNRNPSTGPSAQGSL